jgi:release factor glutamine methyltransferase
LEIELKNFTPRSGLIINEILINNSEIVQGKKVLDLGTGEPGTIAQVAHVLGGRVTGVDIDESAIDHARLSSLQASDIEFLQSDLFGALPGRTFDVIFTNPPQMPSNDPNGHVHDVSGQDGRDAVNQILVESAKYLNDDGSLYLLVFDFLGVDESFNSQPSLFRLGKNKWF